MHSIAQASTATPAQTEQRDPSAPAPKKWTFLDKDSGDPRSFTCMPGCVIRHALVDEGQKKDPAEILCWTRPNGAPCLPIDANGTPENIGVLSAFIEVRPLATSMAERLPHVVLEFVEDQHIHGLDPDSLDLVIDTLTERLDALRRTRADMVRLRAEYLGQPVTTHAPERPAFITHAQLQAMTDSYCGITSLLAYAGQGMFRLGNLKSDEKSDESMASAYAALQFVTAVTEDRANDEAERDELAAETESGVAA